jgi:hypothetical protein
MRWIVCFCVCLSLFLAALPARPQTPAPLTRCGPMPAEAKWPENLPPSIQDSVKNDPQKAAVDVARLQREAQELAELSASIPADINRVNRGLLPKDVIGKLKRVEKLSKRLRSELTQ